VLSVKCLEKKLRVTGLPDYFYLIFGNLGIGRHNREPFQLSLSNEQSIEWVSMMIRKREDMNPVRKASTFQRGGSFTPLEKVSNRVFALKGLWPGRPPARRELYLHPVRDQRSYGVHPRCKQRSFLTG